MFKVKKLRGIFAHSFHIFFFLAYSFWLTVIVWRLLLQKLAIGEGTQGNGYDDIHGRDAEQGNEQGNSNGEPDVCPCNMGRLAKLDARHGDKGDHGRTHSTENSLHHPVVSKGAEEHGHEQDNDKAGQHNAGGQGQRATQTA